MTTRTVSVSYSFDWPGVGVEVIEYDCTVAVRAGQRATLDEPADAPEAEILEIRVATMKARPIDRWRWESLGFTKEVLANIETVAIEKACELEANAHDDAMERKADDARDQERGL